jgi:ferredoxin
MELITIAICLILLVYVILMAQLILGYDKVKSFKPDVIEYDYFRTAGQLLEFPDVQEAVKDIPSILVHHNQYLKAIRMYDFEKLGIKKIVHHNKKGIELYQEVFGNSDNCVHIQLGTDLDEFGLCGKELSCHTCRVNFMKGYDKLVLPAEEEEDVFPHQEKFKGRRK